MKNADKNTDDFIKIVCEGSKTEPIYINGFLKAEGYKIANAAYKPKDHSPKGIANEAVKQLKLARKLGIPLTKIKIWAVFDRDGHAGIPEAVNLLKQYAINFCFSNICFEFWVLLHYQLTARTFLSCDDVISFIRTEHDKDYAKANDHFERLIPKLTTAIENARWLTETHWKFDERPIWERNPFTDVHRLFTEFRKKPEPGSR